MPTSPRPAHRAAARPTRRTAVRTTLTTLSVSGLIAAGVAVAPAGATPAPAAGDKKPPTAGTMSLQLLSFNDYHGHLEAGDPPLPAATDPSQTKVGGVEYLSSTLSSLRAKAPKGNTLTVAAGDLIGGSTFLSGLFHDEPSVESLNTLGLDVSSVGNHEFDEGTAELLRMQNGGCHPVDGCYFPGQPYAGANFQWLAANVVKKSDGQSLLPGTSIKKVNGVNVGFIGMTLKATPTLVSPGGVSTVDFLDEVTTANAEAAKLRKRGVEAIVVLLHEGGYQSGTYNSCQGISGPIVQIASQLDPSIDEVITGHTHQAYVCSIPDPAGAPRLVTSAASYGQMVTESNLVIDRRTKDVVRTLSTAQNHLVTQTTKDPAETRVIDKWKALSAPRAGRVVGTIAEDITGDASGNRGIETPMADMIADAILAGTSGANGGAQIAFMNVGGVRASLLRNTITNGEKVGEVTYAEAYATSPFGNLLVSLDLTGAQIKQVLEQQYQPVAARGSRPMLALGVSKGFTYSWDASQPQGSRAINLALNGVAIDPAKTYRVGTLSFLAEGGDLFTAFKDGKNLVGGPEDLANLVAYLGANPGLTAPASRVDGL
ncbi:bifunctional metallophosphatase/5'-nucleotidase [Arsenicicoccus piscis]|uniref:5'-nucleotidase n=1 Tax=Arsenicicoccus piscis TaxID=673954 RepID=A0ABQ6HU36_9MICO|nr:bifunctional metallophosphatase/5'-nucleotidase [Arsenicicoccus piscis]MCH8626410.1 bifunctional metallophosphatase/5'-nucleotidase [Arsenicicoccus piscis]GMA21034.1 5'-nucleotidase [Arsenicicoccus piscis]